MNAPVRVVSIDEKFTWGKCPVCEAKHGQPCDPSKVSFGQKIDGSRLGVGEGAHAERLKRAPNAVALTPLERKRR